MIEYALLIMLGFCACGLIALLLAPTLWHRAVRLTTKRLEATMPMSLSDIEADKDLLRASYAIQIRRLEAGLSKARDKSANQLVEVSKLQMRIGELGNQISALETRLEERRNAANVFENTIRKRFPELENMVAAAKTALDGRAQEITDLTNMLSRREEALVMSQRAAQLQQQEILKLRETLEQKGADITGRFKRRPSQWTLEEYRSEYDRLNIELSKMREQLILSQERESGQISVLKTELQRLGERMMASAAAQDTQIAAAPKPESERVSWPSTRPEAAPTVSRRGMPPRPRPAAQPWPGEQPMDAAAPPQTPPARPSVPAETASRVSSTRRWTEAAVATPPNAASARPDAVPNRPIANPADDANGAKADVAAREALKALLDRSPRPSAKDNLFDVADAETPEALDAPPELAPAQVETRAAILSEATQDLPPTAGTSEPTAAANGQATEDSASATTADAATEPKLEKVFREIFESRAAAQSPAADKPRPDQGGAAEKTETADLETAEAGAQSGAGTNKTRTLLDRLRVMQERQTG